MNDKWSAIDTFSLSLTLSIQWLLEAEIGFKLTTKASFFDIYFLIFFPDGIEGRFLGTANLLPES